MRFHGKIAIITGGASGIGAASVRRFHAEGASVMIADLSDAGASLADELGNRAAFHPTDVSDPQAVEALVAATVLRFGGVDILYNNAGIGCFGETPDLAIEDWRRVIAVDLDAVFYACRAAIPEMRKRGGGVILNTASASGLAGDYGFTAYNAAKGAVVNYTRSLAIDHTRDNIRANAICPGPVDTPILTDGVMQVPGLREAWEQAVPMKRFARAVEIAAVACFLASDDASFVTGIAIPVDGGLGAHTGQPDLRRVFAAAATSSPDQRGDIHRSSAAA